MDQETKDLYIREIFSFKRFSQRDLGREDQQIEVYPVFEPQNESNPLKRKTGLFDPSVPRITLFCEGRDLKDVLRTLGHEMVHWDQMCRGQLTEEFMGAVAEGSDVEHPIIGFIEEEASGKGSNLLRKYTNTLKEGMLDIYSQYVLSRKKEPQEELPQKTFSKKFLIKRQGNQKPSYLNKKSDPQDPFEKLNSMCGELSSRNNITGPEFRNRRFESESVVEFDKLFQNTFGKFLEECNFELASYYEPAIFYEYTMKSEDQLVVISMFPCGLKNTNGESIDQPILTLMVQTKKNNDAFDFTFKHMKSMYKKLRKILAKREVVENEPT